MGLMAVRTPMGRPMLMTFPFVLCHMVDGECFVGNTSTEDQRMPGSHLGSACPCSTTLLSHD